VRLYEQSLLGQALRISARGGGESSAAGGFPDSQATVFALQPLGQQKGRRAGGITRWRSLS